MRSTLAEAVREQMVSEVPLGAFLSGGIDSTIIAGLMQQASNRRLKTFSIGFPDRQYDETQYAELAACHLATEHQTFIVEPRAWDRFRSWPGILMNRSAIAQPCRPGMYHVRRTVLSR